MRILKKKLVVIVSIVCCVNNLIFSQSFETTSNADKLEWHTNIGEVHELSKATNKPVFAFFTGSDWCIWCKKLQKEVFAKPEFIEWANKNVILLELDFPRNTVLSPELSKQNNSLRQLLKVTSYPTVWIFFTSIDEATSKINVRPIGGLGYPDNPEPGNEQIKFLENANRILDQIK